MWSLGCVFAELLNQSVLFPGQGEVDQLHRMFRLLGAPDEQSWPGYSLLPHAGTLKFKGPAKSRLRDEFPSNSFSGKTYLDGEGLDLLQGMLRCDPGQRNTAGECEKHGYFSKAPHPSKVKWNFKSEREGEKD